MSPVNVPDLPRYRCHKVVEALKLADVRHHAGRLELVPDDPDYPPFQPPHGWLNRYHGAGSYDPNKADYGYYVVYEDGYASWSPSKAFEEGYTRIESDGAA